MLVILVADCWLLILSSPIGVFGPLDPCGVPTDARIARYRLGLAHKGLLSYCLLVLSEFNRRGGLCYSTLVFLQ